MELMEPIAQIPDTVESLRRLAEWDITGLGLHPGGSNYVFVTRLEDPAREPREDEDDSDPEGALYAIYKPSSGERPLRDFPYGTLHNRERAAYLMSAELGWPRIPPTVIRDGPHGEGSVQLFIDADHDENTSLCATSAWSFSSRWRCLMCLSTTLTARAAPA